MGNTERPKTPGRAWTSRRRLLSGAAALSVAVALPRASLGGSWRPAKTIRIITSVSPGGTTDVIARLLAAHLQAMWGQSVFVENRSGGGGTIATAEVVNQDGDGHTILVTNPGPTAIAYSIFRNLTYRPDQLRPVSNFFRIPNTVSAHPSVGISSIKELIAFLKANPDGLAYASSGTGQTPHLTGAWFLQLTGLKMAHVPFRGAGPALQAVLAGNVEILFDNLYPSLPQILAGKLVGLAITTPERNALAPNLPTMRESAPELASFDVSSWCGAFLPGNASPPIVDALNEQIGIMLQREDVRKTIAGMGALTDYSTPQQFSDFVRAETAKFAGIITRDGLQMDIN